MKYFIIKFSLISILISFYSQAQILNGDFEDWSGGEPVSWYSSNDPVCSPGAVNIFQTSNAFSGNSAVYGKIISVYDTCINGTNDFTPSISTYSWDSDLIGFPISGRPKQLRVHYIYKPVGEGGAFTASIYLTRWDISQGERVVVGTGGFFIFNTVFLDSTYAENVSPMTYYLDEDPDTIVISFSLFSNEVGSEFYLDDISLSFMQLVRPSNDDVIIAGEKDTIEWDAGSGNINILYSLDDGNSYTTIVSNYPADSSKYIWDVPDDLLSAKARLKIEDSQDNTQNDEKSVYIKPWQLTRIDDNGDFELFEPDQDGWSFVNDNPPMWPQPWWQQFDYKNGIDSSTGFQYPNIWPFNKALSSWFPDWQTFVKVFGKEQCYYPGPMPPYKSRAMSKWNAIKDTTWDGSCEGFAVSSILYFYYKDDFLNIFSGVGDYDNLYSASITEDARDAISQYYTHQFGKPFSSDYFNKEKNVIPDVIKTIQDLKDMFGQNNTDAKPLIIQNNNTGGGWHTITPYKLERIGNTSVFNLRVYNNNFPGAKDKIIKLDSSANRWTDLSGTGFGSGQAKCYLGLNSKLHFDTPLLFKPGSTIASTSANTLIQPSRIEIYSTSNTNMNIKANLGGETGYGDSLIFNSIKDAIPIVPKTGYPHPPIGYNLPADVYTIQMWNFKESSSYVSFITDSIIYNFRRYDAKLSDNDKLYFSDGLGLTNHDDSQKTITLETVIDNKDSEKVFILKKLQITQGDSINIKEMNRKNLLLNNYGTNKNYDIRLRSASANGEKIFNHGKINLAENTSHQIIPSWINLETEPLKILIDNDNDGTIDDSILVDNQPTDVKDIYSSNTPNNYSLSQNYPNPFNPTTTITFDIPKQSHVTLIVYNILGQKITTLINETKQAGTYREIFDASSLPSGVYVYRLMADEFSSTKKMLLLK